MIGRLRGELIEMSGTTALLDVGGVGYEVTIPESVLLELPAIGNEATLLIRQVFRENEVSLYGFATTFQRRLFDLLTGVKGCGPKIGMALLGQLGENAVADSIAAQDPRALARATGVGPKLAERIILELKEKIVEEKFTQRVIASGSRPESKAPVDELVDALLTLGYRRSDAEIAADEARAEGGDIEDQIRRALRILVK